MAERLIAQYDPDIPVRIADTLKQVHRKFDSDAFVSDCLRGYADLNLMQRGSHIADALFAHLPSRYPEAIDIVLASLHAKRDTPSGSLASFFYLPHTCFVARYGIDHFDASMQAQYQLTQRFTAEFSIRPFLTRYQHETLAVLKGWANDASEQVRRLVSEGTRPRLPWAPRLRQFQKDPQPVLALLELLKDDESPYVRRSVANNLNDIGKDHPALLVETVRKWLDNATPQREQLVRHALRSSIKRADADALAALGYGQRPEIEVQLLKVQPNRPLIGESFTFAVRIGSFGSTQQKLMVDLKVGYRKANGVCRPKVFKFTTLTLTPGESVELNRKISLMQLTTRKHYPGLHTLELIVNGHGYALCEVDVAAC